MCGIAGIFVLPGSSLADPEGAVRAMTQGLAHRGPDASGLWSDGQAGIFLGHRRLSILDLSPAGAQPMASASGRYVLVYNGEAYNHLELRPELEAAGHSFRGTSDTETILAGVEQWGLRPCLERLVGMFALALWDAKERSLTLVRDRLGIKPLYVARAGGVLAFASELSVLENLPGFDARLDQTALAAYLRHGYVPAPRTVYASAAKLEPGTLLRWNARGRESREAWWSAREVWARGAAQPFAGSEEEAAEALDGLLRDAVRQRLLSDVPLGVFLSGGTDSSLVAACAQAASTEPVRTFSIGFERPEYDESAHAAAVAKALGANHTAMTVAPADLLACVDELPRIWDEPFGDSSQVPTLLLCRLTRRHVTVALSGDGGDELFLGYQRYQWGLAWNLLRRLPPGLGRGLAGVLGLVPRGLWSLAGARGGKLHARLPLLTARDFPEFYRRLTSCHQAPTQLLAAPTQEQPRPVEPGDDRNGMLCSMSLADVLHYLPDDILTKVDRASMSVGLEARVPLLDHRVVELAASLPPEMQHGAGVGKRVLKKVLYRHLPQELMERPKQGFAVPLEHWLSSELREWAGDLLGEASLRRGGVLNADAVRGLWSGYLAGRREHHAILWNLLMLQAWLLGRT